MQILSETELILGLAKFDRRRVNLLADNIRQN